MICKYFNFIKVSKLLKRFVGILSILVMSGLPIEAAGSSKKSTTVKTSVKKRSVVRKARPQKAKVAPKKARASKVSKRKARTTSKTRVQKTHIISKTAAKRQTKQAPRVTPAPVKSVPVKTPAPVKPATPVKAPAPAVKTTPVKPATPAKPAPAPVQTPAPAKPAPVKPAQAAAARLAELLNRPFTVNKFTRFTDAFLEEEYLAYDLGYQGGSARTQQYEELHLPAAPVFHPYRPTGEMVGNVENQRGYLAPAFTLNVKSPRYSTDFGPPALHRNVTVQPENVDTFLEFQDMPWIQGLRDLLFRPQSWLDAKAQNSHPVAYSKTFKVDTGVYSNRPNGPRIRHAVEPKGRILNPEQPEGGLVASVVTTHNTVVKKVVVDQQVISSPNSLPVRDLDLNRSHVLYSLTIHGNKAAIGRHVLLNPHDQQEFKRIQKTQPRHLTELKARMQAAKAAGRGFADLDPDEVFKF